MYWAKAFFDTKTHKKCYYVSVMSDLNYIRNVSITPVDYSVPENLQSYNHGPGREVIISA